MKKKIIVVGGGTAGWMTAAYLHTKHPEIEITLLESSAIPIIGVGESTVPSFVDFIHTVGLTEEDLFESMGSIRKYTANHNDWNYKGHSWWHHFIFNDDEEPEQVAWLKNNQLPDKKWRHSYHIDGNKFAILLRDKIGANSSIKHVYDTVTDVEYNEDGIVSVTGLSTEYQADLYIDCSGFKRLLINKFALDKERNTNLINNRAWAAHADYNGKDILHYTRTFAMDAGWQWNICLQDRIGVGYVFCEKHISPEQARKEFLNHCPFTIREDSLRLLDFTSEWHNKVWHKNMLAIGLSAGFLEPLESQSIFLTQMQIQMLDRLLDKKNGEQVYNKFWNMMIRHLSQYLEVHYTLSSRTDTSYWRSFDKIKHADYKHTYSPLFHQYSYDAINSAYADEDTRQH